MKVIVLGGGVAGMSAAHELAERDFEVVVYETRAIPGGKARSMPVPGSGTGGRPDLPAEHGFRFFPGFYRHLPDTMRRIPFGGESEGVFGNLVPTSRVQMALEGREEIVTPARFPATVDDLEVGFRSLLAHAATLGIPPQDQAYFVNRLLVLLTSCDQRRFAEYEHQSWWEFSGAQTRSAAYGKCLADGLTRTLVAAKAHEMSARTGGAILLQLLFDLSRPGGHVDSVLNGPTNDVWIDPWLAHLRSLGVDYRSEHQVQAIHTSDARVTGVSIVAQGRPFVDTADFYVAAVPVEVMRLLADDEMKQADPRLAGLHLLRTRWMNGIMFYLDRDVAPVHGHSLYIDSPWALTSISQAQFWRGVTNLERMGDGRVAGILSVDISDWEAKGIVHGKQAMFCSKEEVRDEVWAQLKGSLNDAGIDVLDDANVLGWFLDPDIVYPNPTEATNLEPLLINTAGSWEHRPEAETSIENLFLASDYVRTHTDLATMEGANEAARRAVNGILDRSGSTQPLCSVWRLSEPAILAPARTLDRLLFALRRPLELPVRARDDGRIHRSELISLGASAVERISRLLPL
ncbi:MAG: FAD-dependent oxidoreductase [Actinomycetota bacterium]